MAHPTRRISLSRTDTEYSLAAFGCHSKPRTPERIRREDHCGGMLRLRSKRIHEAIVKLFVVLGRTRRLMKLHFWLQYEALFQAGPWFASPCHLIVVGDVQF